MSRRALLSALGVLSMLLAAAGCASESEAGIPAVASTTADGSPQYRYGVLSEPAEAVGANLPRTALPSEVEKAVDAFPVSDDPARPAYVIRSTAGRLCLTVMRQDGAWGYTCGDPDREQRGGIVLLAEPGPDNLWNVSALVPDGAAVATVAGEQREVRHNFVRFSVSKTTPRVGFSGPAYSHTLDLAGLIQ